MVTSPSWPDTGEHTKNKNTVTYFEISDIRVKNVTYQ